MICTSFCVRYWQICVHMCNYSSVSTCCPPGGYILPDCVQNCLGSESTLSQEHLVSWLAQSLLLLEKICSNFCGVRLSSERGNERSIIVHNPTIFKLWMQNTSIKTHDTWRGVHENQLFPMPSAPWFVLYLMNSHSCFFFIDDKWDWQNFEIYQASNITIVPTSNSRRALAQRGFVTDPRPRPIVTEESRSVKSLLLTVERSAHTAEMDGLIKKWAQLRHPCAIRTHTCKPKAGLIWTAAHNVLYLCANLPVKAEN